MKYFTLLLSSFVLLNITQLNAQCWQSVSCGDQYVGAVKNDGSLFMWGTNTSGQLGNGNNVNLFTTSSQVIGNDWQSVATSKSLDNNTGTGSSHTLAIKTDGSLWTWGNNDEGQLGNGTNISSNVPVQIGTDTNWAKVVAGSLHSLALKTDGTLWAWGHNAYGQVGNGTFINVNTPTQIGSANNWSDISTYESHSLGIKTDGTLWAWGKNNYYQLSQGNNQNKNTPSQIGSSTNWLSVSAGYQYSFAIQQDSSLWAWGNNSIGQLGNGSIGSFNPNPIQIGATSKWIQVSSGREHTVALQANGTLWGWGMNFFGQLGQGNNSFQILSPVQITTDSNFTFINNGHYYSMAISSDTTMWGWGQNYSNVLFTNDNSNKNLLTAVGCPAVTNYYSSISVSSCSSYISPSGNYTWTNSGVYIDTIPIATGGDSLIIINLTINAPNTGIDFQTACDTFTWIDGSTYTSSNNTASLTLTNVDGCDSIVTLDLTLNHSSTALDTQTACNSFTWIDGNTYSSNNTSATHTLTNAVGCDSVVTLNLTINSLLTSVSQSGATLTADELGATYQWLSCPSFTPINGAISRSFTTPSNGDYAVVVSNINCSDTSDCYSVTNVGMIENDLEKKISLYPNPSTGHFSIDLSDINGEVGLSITDTEGRVVQSGSYLGAQLVEINLDEAAGIYLLMIEAENKKAVIRLITQ